MNNENWNPGHSLNKGYPYNGVESMRSMQNRPSLQMDDHGKIVISWNEKHFGPVKDNQKERTELEDFLLHRLYDFQETLSIAEDQVQDLLEEGPFVPESYGFVVVAKNKTITEQPVRIYQSVFNPSHSLFRKPQDTTRSFDASKWTLLSKNENGSFSELELSLPCDRIAYAVFFGLGIPMEKKEGEEAPSAPTREIIPARGTKWFVVKFKRDINLFNDEKWETIERKIEVEAQNESDALIRAKFHLETNPDESFDGVTAQELEIVD